MNYKKRKKLSEDQAKELFVNILEQMFNYNIISYKDYFNSRKTNFNVKKDNFKFFFKSYSEALLKLEKTIYYQKIVDNLPIFKHLIKNSFDAGYDLLFNHYYQDDFDKEYTNLPVKVWFPIIKKLKIYNKYNYERIIVQNSSSKNGYCSNIMTIKLFPELEIIENYGFKNELTINEKNILFDWINKNKVKIKKIIHSYKKYYKEINILRYTDKWKV